MSARWILAAALLAAPVEAADPANGGVLAQRWCSGCHAVAGESALSDANATFAQIAARRADQPGYVRAFLVKPHAPMPNLTLSNRELDDLAAYIKSLAPPHR
jgi:mono/diheme cytochrome c family protein